jgi:hypothetical protein
MDQPEFKRKKGLSKLLLKLDRQEYKKYKAELYIHAISEKLRRFSASHRLFTPENILRITRKKGKLNLRHSGNAGDIMYALPTVKEIHALTGVPVHFLLNLGKPLDILPHYQHPLGSVMLNRKMADMLIPLLSAQPYIASCKVYSGEEIDIDLDDVKLTGLSFDRGNIAAWYNYISGLRPDLAQPWLSAAADTGLTDTVIVARSSRYTNPNINYAFLNETEQLAFVGVSSEYEAFKRIVPHARYIEVNDFLQLACAISGCRLFIGNQSFPYSVAEALKVRRLLETAVDAPNVLPEGGQCYGFYFQQHFEWYVKEWSKP